MLRARSLALGVAVAAAIVTGCADGSTSETSVRPEPTLAPPSSVLAPSPASPSPPGATTSTTGATSPTSATSPASSTSETDAAAEPITAAHIAEEINASERAIHDLALGAAEVAAAGRRQQRAYRLLARHGDLRDDVSALIGDDVRPSFDANVRARQAVVDHAAGTPPSDPPATLPAWTIVEPRPIDELLAAYRAAQAATGVPWQYLAAINFVETRMGRILGESSAGARGPMQFLPETWAACCEGDIDDPRDAILGAATYLVQRGAPADMQAALYGYNPNDGYVGSVTAYAEHLMADELAYRGYHAWEVFVGSAAGTIRLPVGFRADEPVDALTYAAEHPEDVV